MAWIVAATVHGETCVMTGPKRRDIRDPTGAKIGEAAWVTKKSAAGGAPPMWWLPYAWLLDTKEEAEIALEILNEKVAAGECSEFNRPSKAWVEEV